MRAPLTHPSPKTTAIAGLVALAVAMGIGRFAFTPILPMMQDDAHLSVAAGGWLASANYLGYLLGALAALRTRVPASMAIRGGLAAIGVATLAMGATQDFTAWLLLRAAAGIASAWVLIFVSAWSLERLAFSPRPQLASVVFAGVGAGIALAGALCLALMRARSSSSDAWMVFGALALVLAAAVWPAFGRAGPPPCAIRPCCVLRNTLSSAHDSIVPAQGAGQVL